jgi:hypothetical protein
MRFLQVCEDYIICVPMRQALGCIWVHFNPGARLISRALAPRSNWSIRALGFEMHPGSFGACTWTKATTAGLVQCIWA